MKTLWEELTDCADALAVAGKVDVPTLRLMRAAAVQMENWFVACEELREGFRIPCESIAYAADATKHTTLPLLHQRTHVSRGGDAMGFAA